MARKQLAKSVQLFYSQVLAALKDAEIPHLIGGAFAMAHYTGIQRDSKDLDIFVLPQNCRAALARIAEAGFRTELSYPHWLGKVFHHRDFIDIIFSSGNGIARVDSLWFKHAVQGTFLDFRVRFCPVEEMIWSKAYVMERERYDGADIAHLIRACGSTLDWSRLLARFAADWEVLLSHVILFGYVYPNEDSQVPAEVLQELLGRLERGMGDNRPRERLCRGPLFSRAQYLDDLHNWGYQDARLQRGHMTKEEISLWTAGCGH